MSYRHFRLETLERGAPSTGEDLGFQLRAAGCRIRDAYEGQLPEKRHYTTLFPAIQLFHLAADAYRAGASWSIGHNRADAYERAAHDCDREAERLADHCAAERDRIAAERAARG